MFPKFFRYFWEFNLMANYNGIFRSTGNFGNNLRWKNVQLPKLLIVRKKSYFLGWGGSIADAVVGLRGVCAPAPLLPASP
ncbi:MAG TPA: hypothetical protein DEG17_04465 [Cyanobacteria bacterium UBA11149]|nr:hypothetical protein [Cyanobacteria bacterium UBA11367]HBE58499.1 hypothetical protein [Cyanobacteria bacterium UBA11366]HBK63266.1 hypothetical protein [Cyanobacteria bacterium UBA11166]HBR73555.1 hypothetical protein [Cyanobacteria bacterium UBA11159]HBS71397.1 hypothetical protein [Cyanobacteria bacterium UBA11153]HBW88144.1 hypothetical protein [Cyanobacteria bacterium UBA11149]HCA95262.1 hypothetical protein [Cyanobacteria bacterium UBA9226]